MEAEANENRTDGRRLDPKNRKPHVVRHTRSVCPVCLKQIPAVLAEENGIIWMEKSCAEHGFFRTPVWRGMTDMEQWRGPIPEIGSEEQLCCPDCTGICTQHQQGSCCVLLEVTSACDLHCPYCFARGGEAENGDLSAKALRSFAAAMQTCSSEAPGAEMRDAEGSSSAAGTRAAERSGSAAGTRAAEGSGSAAGAQAAEGSGSAAGARAVEGSDEKSCSAKAQEPSQEQLRRAIDAIYRQGRRPTLQLSGGEPTQRDDLPALVAYAREKGAKYVQLNTNGLRLARDPAYVDALAEAGLSFVFLQFDGVDDRVYQMLRGKPLLEEKLRVIEACDRRKLGVTLVPTIVRGVNEDQIGAIFKLAVSLSPAVRGVHFQPVSYFGRYPDLLTANPHPYGTQPAADARYTLDELLHALETQAGIGYEHILPSCCDHPLCGFHSSFVIMPGGIPEPLSQRAAAESGRITSAEQNRDYIGSRWERSADCCCCGEEAAEPPASPSCCCGEETAKTEETPPACCCCGEEAAEPPASPSCCCGEETAKTEETPPACCCCGEETAKTEETPPACCCFGEETAEPPEPASCCCGEETAELPEPASCCCGEETAKTEETPPACCCGEETAEPPLDMEDMDVFLERVQSHAFTVTAMAFQDAGNLDIERLRRCSLHVYADGALRPFCSHYLTPMYDSDTGHRKE